MHEATLVSLQEKGQALEYLWRKQFCIKRVVMGPSYSVGLRIMPDRTPVTEPKGDSLEGLEGQRKFHVREGFIHVHLVATRKLQDEIAF